MNARLVSRQAHVSWLVLLTLWSQGTADSQISSLQRAQAPSNPACASVEDTCPSELEETSLLQTRQRVDTRTTRGGVVTSRAVAGSGATPPLRPTSHNAAALPASTYRQTLYNFDDVQYTAQISVGGQLMNGVLDTGSFELLVFSVECDTCGPQVYNSSASSSYSQGMLMASHEFGSGAAYSEEAFDNINVGPLSAGHQNFWKVYAANMPVLQVSNFQAIVGVGPPNVPSDEAQASVEASQTLMNSYTLANQNVPQAVQTQYTDAVDILNYVSNQTTLLDTIGTNVFSVCLQRAPGSNGYFVWNDVDPTPNIFTILPVSGTSSWGLSMNNVHFATANGQGLGTVNLGCDSGCAAVVDSGTSLIAVPPSVMAAVGDAILQVNEDCSNINALPDLKFTVAGQELSLPPDAYMGQLFGTVPASLAPFMHQKTTSHICDVLLMSIDSTTQFGPMWIFGMPFFRNFYTTFSLTGSRSISVAPASATCEAPQPPSLVDAARSSMAPASRQLAPLRRINADRLRLPPWAIQVHGKKLNI